MKQQVNVAVIGALSYSMMLCAWVQEILELAIARAFTSGEKHGWRK